MRILSNTKKAYYIYKSTNKRKMFKALHEIKKQFGLRGLKIAVSNKINGYPLLLNLQLSDESSLLNSKNGVNFDQTGNDIFEKQQNEFTAKQIKERIECMKIKPLISVIMPLYNPPIKWLEKAVESLQKQYYENWELCVVDDGSEDGRGCAYLESIAKNDSRVFINKMMKNEGISSASNKSLIMARGEYIALMDQDDEITPDAFFWFANEIHDYPETDFIYSDECQIGLSNVAEKTDFYFKPDWSPALLINHMYTGHMSVYRTELVKKTGGFRSEFDFSQDYDLALRMSDVTKNIRHIERVLYFWRKLPTSGAGGGKDFARISNLGALGDWYKRQGLKAIIEKWHVANYGSIVTTENPKVSIVIPSDSLENLKQCIHGLLTKTSYKNIEIILVTNSKTASDILNEYPYLDILKVSRYDKTYNFSDKCNVGANMAEGQILIFYNDDVAPMSKDWIERQIEILFYQNVGGVSPLMVYENNTVQYAGMTTGVPGIIGTMFNGVTYFCAVMNSYNQLLVKDVSVLCGACTVMKKSVFDEIGGFDAENTANGQSDLDLSLKLLEKGYRCVCTPYAVMIHTGNHSWVAKNKVDKADIYCLKRWGKYIRRDPYFTDSMKKMFYVDFNYHYKIYSPDNLIVPKEKNARDILIITHELSRTGAPIVLRDFVQIILDNCDFPVVLSPVDGPLKNEFLEMGVTVIIDESFMHNHWMFEHFARNFDLVVANTLGCANAVNLLKNSLPPVLWWIHEGTYALKHFKHMLPRKLGDNVKVFAISDYARQVLKDSGIKYECRNLTWGVSDIQRKMTAIKKDDKVVFLIIGSIEERKGQDVVLKAIEKLDEHYKSIAEFVFIGNPLEKNMHEKLLELHEEKQYISYMGSMPRTEIFKYYEKATCVIIPSRDEPLSLIAVEAMIFSKPFICSDHTGITQYITDGQNGYIFPNEDVNELEKKIKHIITHKEVAYSMGKAARKIYEKNFTMDNYRESVNRLIEEIL